MKCLYFEKQQCLSCTHIRVPQPAQVSNKNQILLDLLSEHSIDHWLAPIFGSEQAFRNKAKMVALGDAHAPLLGIVGPSGEAVSLCDCNLYPADMQQLLHRLETFVRQAGLPPYKVDKARGELKYILLTRSQHRGEYLLRFVLRSTQAIERIRRNLPQLLFEYPQIKVVSANIQPVHMAILEGDEEVFFTEATSLEERFNDVPLFIRPKSFFQTNPQVAAKLYQTAREWVSALSPESIWDLFCGVGGFGLHCANADIALTGIEIESEAIRCAKLSAEILGLKKIDFRALDSDNFALGQSAHPKPDVIIVNPPRRGIGQVLCQSINTFLPSAILYSSCNATSLAQDLRMLRGYRINKVQMFDMFPHTDHFEVLVLLLRQP